MYYVYILETEYASEHWYVGFTANLERRLVQHNAGLSHHTSKYGRWKIKVYFAFTDRKKAEDFELYLKSHAGRSFAKKHF